MVKKSIKSNEVIDEPKLGPAVELKTYYLNLINASEDGPKRMHVSEEIMKFIELVASSRLNASFQRVYTLEGLTFTASEKQPDEVK